MYTFKKMVDAVEIPTTSDEVEVLIDLGSTFEQMLANTLNELRTQEFSPVSWCAFVPCSLPGLPSKEMLCDLGCTLLLKKPFPQTYEGPWTIIPQPVLDLLLDRLISVKEEVDIMSRGHGDVVQRDMPFIFLYRLSHLKI